MRLTVPSLILLLAACSSPSDPAGSEGDTAVVDSDVSDTAVPDTSVDTSAEDTAISDSTLDDTEVDDTNVADTTDDDTAAVDTTDEDAVEDTDPGDTGEEDTDPGDTGEADTGVEDTGLDDTGLEDTGSDVDPDVDPAVLRDALQAQMSEGHINLGYTGARNVMYAVGGYMDVDGRIECIYTGRTVTINGSRTPSDDCRLADGTPSSCGFNTEHTWARFYLDLYLTEGTEAYDTAEADLHHIYPSEENANTVRWHFLFGDTECEDRGDCALNEESHLGQLDPAVGTASCTRSLELDDDCVMEVRPERAGDIARAQFYMAVRYGMPIPEAMETALRAWHAADPPDDWERARNDGIEAAQGNRNVFVDDPTLVDQIPDF